MGPHLRWNVIGLVCAAALAAGPPARAQTSPFVDPGVDRALRNELSGDVALDFLRTITQWHRPSGSAGFFATARYVRDQAQAFGLEDVTWTDQVGEAPAWTCRNAEAWLLVDEPGGTQELKLGSFAEVATSVADHSRSADVTAELVDVGAGDDAKSYTDKNVKGKLVLAFGSLNRVMEEAVWQRGALGIIAWSSTRLDPLADAADQIAWQSVPSGDGPNGERTTFAFIVSARTGQQLAERLRGEPTRHLFSAPTPPKERLRAHVIIDAETQKDSRSAMVTARLRGTDPSLAEVVLTAHLQEEKFSANDDGSGVANLLEIGRALARLIRDGKLARPRRGIRFWWSDEVHSEYRWFADHPDDARKVLCDLNQDMVGARQSLGGRVEQLSRTPWTRPSYLNDVVESILDMVVAGNHGYLNAWQAGQNAHRSPYTQPLLAHLGSREPYHAQAVPHFAASDHLVFVDAWIGVPAVTLTNWPDEYIHSSADDLWQIDPTQLKRNGFVIAAAAWWLANAQPAHMPLLAAHVYAHSQERLARDFATAIALLSRTDTGDPPAERYAQAQSLITTSSALAAATVATAGFADPANQTPVAKTLVRYRQQLEEQKDRYLTNLREAAAALLGAVPAPASPSDVERRLQRRVPRKAVSTLAAWLDLDNHSHDRVAGTPTPARLSSDKHKPRLHPVMRNELLNLCDGKRDALTITRFLQAEAASAGPWVYGPVTAAMVEDFLENQHKDGRLTW